MLAIWWALQVTATRAEASFAATTQPEAVLREQELGTATSAGLGIEDLPRGSIRKGRSVGINHKQLEFDALDCSTPWNVTSTTMVRSPECQLEEEPLREKRVAVRVLQKADKTHFFMRRCRARRYKMSYNCGYATGHSAIVGNEWAFDVEEPVTEEGCRGAWKDHRYRGQKVKENGTTHLYFATTGTDWAVKTDVHCEGGYEWFERQQWGHKEREAGVKGASNMMRKDHINLELSVVRATVDSAGRVLDNDNQVFLPCDLREESCTVQGWGTYVWREPDPAQRCPLYSTRPEAVEGSYLSAPETPEDVTFLSTDGSMIRLEKRDPVSLCGGLVHKTDYAHLYLTEDLEQAEFLRPLHESELSLATYSNAKDEYLYHDVVGQFAKGLNRLREERCEQSRTQRSYDYARRAAEQKATLSGETAHLGGDRFVSAAGEVWYTYRCRPVIVRARETSGCYDSLPVRLTEDDQKRYLLARGHKEEDGAVVMGNATMPEFFMEPHSHRLTTEGIPSTCAPPFTPLFQNRHRRWVAAAAEGFYMAARPLQLEPFALNLTTVGPEDLDFEEGGVYDAGAIRSMELFSQAPRAGQGLAANLAVQKDGGSNGGYLVQSGDLFPELRGVAGLVDTSAVSFLASLWKWVERYGYACSIVVGTGIFIRAGTWLGGVVMRLFTMPVGGNLCLHVLSAFFPSLRAFLQDPHSACRHCMRRRHDSGEEGAHDQMLMARESRAELLERQQEMIELYAERTVERMAARFKETGRYEEAAGVIKENLYPSTASAPAEVEIHRAAPPPPHRK